MQTISGRAPLCPPPGIHRSPDAFDAIPAEIQARTDITGNAKRLYGLLRSCQNMNAFPSYADLATALGASVRSIVTWMAQLVGAGLITVWRRGLGLTNVATVVDMAIRSANDAATRRKVPHADTRMEPRPKNPVRRNDRNMTTSYGAGRLGTVPAR